MNKKKLVLISSVIGSLLILAALGSLLSILTSTQPKASSGAGLTSNASPEDPSTSHVISSSDWGAFKKSEGILRANQGVIYRVDGFREIEEVANSFDPALGKYTRKFDARTQPDRERVDFKIDGNEIHFYYLDQDGKRAFWTDPGVGWYLTPIPHGNNYILAYNNNLYLLDGNKLTVNELMEPYYEGFSKTEFEQQFYKEYAGNTWASNAGFVSPSGDQLLFFTNRNLITEGDDFREGQIWLKNLHSGEERMIHNENVNVLGWTEEEDAILVQRFDQIKRIDLSTTAVEIISDALISPAFSDSYVIGQRKMGELFKKHVDTGKEEIVLNTGIYRIGSIFPSPGSPWVAIINYLEQNGGDKKTFHIFNVETEEHHNFDEPEGESLKYVEWISETHFLLHTTGTNYMEQYSYEINLDEMIKKGE